MVTRLELRVLMRRYLGETVWEVARRYGLSRERVREMEGEVVRRLAEAVRN